MSDWSTLWEFDAATAWVRHAACAEAPDLPWVADGRPLPEDAKVMTVICAGCPVSAQCGAFVEEADVTAGWWAGASRTMPGGRRRSLSRADGVDIGDGASLGDEWGAA